MPRQTFHPRRSHTKSRLGCGACKRRRIKCDEGKPECGNCARRRVECVYIDSPNESTRNSGHDSSANRSTLESDYDLHSNTSTLGSNIDSHSNTSPLGSSKDLNSTASTLGSNQNLGSTSNTTQLDSTSSETISGTRNESSEFCVADFELMHHYSTHVAQTLGGGPFWMQDLPTMAFRDRGLLHMLLAMSALHMAFQHQQHPKSTRMVDQNETKRVQLSRVADQHYVAALPCFASKLSHLEDNDSQVLSSGAILVCLFTFAKGPSEGQYIAFSDDGKPEWLQLLKGLKSICRRFSHDTPQEQKSTSIRGAVEGQGLPTTSKPGHIEHITKLKKFIDARYSNDAAHKYTPPLDALVDCFVARYSHPQHAEHEHSSVIFSWLYSLSDEYLNDLQWKEPIALLIYAYYAVLLKELEHQWLFRGWAKHILVGVAKHLSPAYHSHIHWPMAQVNEE